MVTSVLAISVHYILEFGKNMGDYECPPYCRVKHKHITQEVINVRNNGYNNVEGQEEEYLYRIEWYDKYPTSEREEGTSLYRVSF